MNKKQKAAIEARNAELARRRRLEGIPMKPTAIDSAMQFIKIYLPYESYPTWMFEGDWRFGYYRKIIKNKPTLDEFQMIDSSWAAVPSVRWKKGGDRNPPIVDVLMKTDLGITREVAELWLINDIKRIALDLSTKDGTWDKLSGASIFLDLDAARQRSLVVAAHLMSVRKVINTSIFENLKRENYNLAADAIFRKMVDHFPSCHAFEHNQIHNVWRNLISEDIRWGDSKTRPRKYHVYSR